MVCVYTNAKADWDVQIAFNCLMDTLPFSPTLTNAKMFVVSAFRTGSLALCETYDRKQITEPVLRGRRLLHTKRLPAHFRWPWMPARISREEFYSNIRILVDDIRLLGDISWASSKCWFAQVNAWPEPWEPPAVKCLHKSCTKIEKLFLSSLGIYIQRQSKIPQFSAAADCSFHAHLQIMHIMTKSLICHSH